MFQFVNYEDSNLHFWSVSTHSGRFRFNNHLHSDRDVLIDPTHSLKPAYE